MFISLKLRKQMIWMVLSDEVSKINHFVHIEHLNRTFFDIRFRLKATKTLCLVRTIHLFWRCQMSKVKPYFLHQFLFILLSLHTAVFSDFRWNIFLASQKNVNQPFSRLCVNRSNYEQSRNRKKPVKCLLLTVIRRQF